MKALKSLLTNRYSTCIIVVCGLEVLPNQEQFQRTKSGTLWIQNWKMKATLTIISQIAK